MMIIFLVYFAMIDSSIITHFFLYFAMVESFSKVYVADEEGRVIWMIRVSRICTLEELKATRFSLLQSEMRESSKLRHALASSGD